MTALHGKPLIRELERRFVVAHTTVPSAGRHGGRDASGEHGRAHQRGRLGARRSAALLGRHLAVVARARAGSGARAGDGAHDARARIGLGLVAIGAMRAGYDVLASDYYDDALLFTTANAWRKLGPRAAHAHGGLAGAPDRPRHSSIASSPRM